MKLLNWSHNRNPFIILIPIAILLAFSFLALYSISMHQNISFFRSAFFRQLIFLIIGIIAMVTMYLIPIKYYHKYSLFAYVLAIISIIIPYFINNPSGANRWIFIGSIGIQPSEYAKWISIIFLARYLSDRTRLVSNINTFIVPITIIFIPALIVFGQPAL